VNRRNMLYSSAAAIAGVAGATLAWWKFQPHQVDASPAETGVVGKAGGASDAFWSLSFDTPDGKNLSMSSFRGKLLLVNFWATWCPPCVEELPLLDYFYQENRDKNLQIVGLAVDQPSAVRTWLQSKPLHFPVGMAGLGGTELSKSLGNIAGSLPFTAVLSASGELLHRKIGKVLPEDLAQWAKLT
jgi:thiol-disulfide isomerase/thioredoxin